MVRDLRWADGVDCLHCQSKHVAKNGHDTTEVFRQRYVCRGVQPALCARVGIIVEVVAVFD